MAKNERKKRQQRQQQWRQAAVEAAATDELWAYVDGKDRRKSLYRHIFGRWPVYDDERVKIGTHVGRISMQTNRRSVFFYLNTIQSNSLSPSLSRMHAHNGTKGKSNNVELARIFPVFALLWLLLLPLMFSNRMELTFADAIHMLPMDVSVCNWTFSMRLSANNSMACAIAKQIRWVFSLAAVVVAAVGAAAVAAVHHRWLIALLFGFIDLIRFKGNQALLDSLLYTFGLVRLTHPIWRFD